MTQPPRVFISYSHDSAEHRDRVLALADRLRGDGIESFLDQYEPAPPEGWPRWMLRQIRRADFVLVVCTETYRRRFESDEEPGRGLGVPWEGGIITQELYEAESMNRRFVPLVMEDSDSDHRPWPLRSFTYYRINEEAGYDLLYRRLTNQPVIVPPDVGSIRHRPRRERPQFDDINTQGNTDDVYRCMPQPPECFIPRQELQEMAGLLCSAANEPGATVAITTALRGAGGFGKTILAQALCHDQRVRAAYPDGILWATMGEELNEAGRLARVRDLILWWSKEAAAFETFDSAAAHLRELLTGFRVLVVVDDVWTNADLAAFQGLGPGTAVLVTTRNSRTLPADCGRIEVDAMQEKEAVQLLAAGLDGFDLTKLGELAARLGEWPLLLKLANRHLVQLVGEAGLSPGDALQQISGDLQMLGLRAFDLDDEEGRNWAVDRTLEVSLKFLSTEERHLYRQLAVFQEDADIPLEVVQRLWGIEEWAARRFGNRLHALSLLLRFDHQKTLRLHDVLRTYLLEQAGERLPELHARLLAALRPVGGNWTDLPKEEEYLWQNLGYHLLGASQGEVFRQLLFEYEYLRRKIEVTDLNGLLADYAMFPLAEAAKLLKALRLSAHVISKAPEQLAPQLLGRLLGSEEEEIQHLLRSAKSGEFGTWLRPRSPTLLAPGSALRRTLEGHHEAVHGIAVLPDGRVVSASGDRTLRVWDLALGESAQILAGHTSVVRAVAVLPDGRVVSASHDATMRVWNLRSGETVQVLSGHADQVLAVATLPDGRVVSASRDTTVRVWDLNLGKTVQTLTGHTDWVLAVAVLPDGRVVSASDDTTVRVWDLSRGDTVQTLAGHGSWVQAVAALPDGQHVVSGSDDKTLRVWNLKRGESVQILEGHSSAVRAVAVLPDGRHVVSAAYDKTLRVWDVRRGESVQILEGHTSLVRAVAALPDGRVVSGSGDTTLRVWDLDRGEGGQAPTYHTSSVLALAVLPGGLVVTASSDNTLRVWNPESGESVQTLKGHTSLVRAVAALPDGRVVSASSDKTLRVWDVSTGESVQILEGHASAVLAVAMLPDGRLVSASSDRTLRVWDLESGESLRTLQSHTELVRAVAVLPDGRAVSASSDKTLRVWDLDNGQSVQLAGHTDWVSAVTVLPDGRVVSASDDKTLRVWDLSTGIESAQTLKGHRSFVRAVAVLPDGRVVSASCDKTLRVWDLSSGESVQTLRGHTSLIRAVAVFPDGRVASVCDAKTLRVWDPENGLCIAWYEADDPLACVAVIDGGLVAGEASGRVHFFDLVEPGLPGMPHRADSREFI